MFSPAPTLLGLVALTSTALAAPLTPSAVEAELAKHGAKAAVAELVTSGAWETVVLRQIDAGSAPWIRLAPLLSKGTDAATAEGLGQSLIYALPKAPEAVLSIVDLTARSVPRAPDTVCSASFYEGDATEPRAYRMAAIQAVSRVADPALGEAKRACLDELEAVR